MKRKAKKNANKKHKTKQNQIVNVHTNVNSSGGSGSGGSGGFSNPIPQPQLIQNPQSSYNNLPNSFQNTNYEKEAHSFVNELIKQMNKQSLVHQFDPVVTKEEEQRLDHSYMHNEDNFQGDNNHDEIHDRHLQTVDDFQENSDANSIASSIAHQVNLVPFGGVPESVEAFSNLGNRSDVSYKSVLMGTPIKSSDLDSAISQDDKKDILGKKAFVNEDGRDIVVDADNNRLDITSWEVYEGNTNLRKDPHILPTGKYRYYNIKTKKFIAQAYKEKPVATATARVTTTLKTNAVAKARSKAKINTEANEV